jgi:uncharacterized SAM-binding protein YcdF (DUF218 family)
MRDFLVGHGAEPADLIVDNAGRTTHENAVESRKLLERRRIREVILVTSACHMLRSVLCFRKQGLVVTPSPCHHRATEFCLCTGAFLPRPEAASACMEVAHEWLGLAWYWLRGRI